MSDYVKATNFAAKDALVTGDPNKKVKGVEIDAEFVALQTAVTTKADKSSPAFTGTPTAPTAATGDNSTIISTTAWVRNLMNIIEPLGTIKAFAGAVGSIPAGWTVCDGTSGTLNLKDRFIVGYGVGGVFGQNSAGGHTAGATTTPIAGTTTINGEHQHGGITAPHAITTAQLPPHTHSVTAGEGFLTQGPSGFGLATDVSGLNVYAPVTGHNYTTSNTGSAEAHFHGIYAEGNHFHTVTGVAGIPGYFTLMFIQKTALL
jgi:hypothetical protein